MRYSNVVGLQCPARLRYILSYPPTFVGGLAGSVGHSAAGVAGSHGHATQRPVLSYNKATSIMLNQSQCDNDFHDWHSVRYVEGWINRIESRPPRMVRQRMARYRSTLQEFAFSGGQPLRILELGIGWADLTRELLDLFPEAELVGLDGSSVMLERARENLAPWSDRVQVHWADLTDKHALEGLGIFDGILTVSTLHHLTLPQLNTLFGQIVNHLKPNGRFINCDFFYRSKRCSSRVLWRLAAIAKQSNLPKLLTSYLENTAFRNQSKEPPPVSTYRKPLLGECLGLLQNNGMRARWQRQGNSFVVVAEFDGATTLCHETSFIDPHMSDRD